MLVKAEVLRREKGRKGEGVMEERLSSREEIPYEDLERAAEVLKAMAHPLRLKIVEILHKNGELTVTEISKHLGISQSLTSQQLGKMKVQGIIKSRREGNTVFYSIEHPGAVKIIHCLMEKRKLQIKKEG